MSEEQQKSGAPTEHSASNGAPAKPSSGFVGKGGARERDEECPPGRSESERTLPRRVSRETSAERETKTPPKNRKSSAYLYLVILFGAAFLMLLLAYFVQQRNNESTISGLQDSWNLSREELLEKNQLLTEKNEELEVRLAVLEDQHDRANRQIDELEVQLYAALNDPVIAEQKNRADVLTLFAILEQALRDKDYEVAAKQVRALCQGDLNLDLGLVNLDGSEHFDPRERLTEIIPMLERQGALAQDEIELP